MAVISPADTLTIARTTNLKSPPFLLTNISYYYFLKDILSLNTT